MYAESTLSRRRTGLCSPEWKYRCWAGVRSRRQPWPNRQGDSTWQQFVTLRKSGRHSVQSRGHGTMCRPGGASWRKLSREKGTWIGLGNFWGRAWMVLAQHAEWKSSDFASAGDAYGCSPVLDCRSSLHRGPPSGIINMKGSFRLETNPFGSFLKLWRAEKFGIQLCANLEKAKSNGRKGTETEDMRFHDYSYSPPVG
jgi:hypothetical protein